MSKPVQLQLNNSGAWKTVASWEATDDSASTKVHEAVELLGQVNEAFTWRITTRADYPVVLKRWAVKTGWVLES